MENVPVIIGRYRLSKTLGIGAFGKVKCEFSTRNIKAAEQQQQLCEGDLCFMCVYARFNQRARSEAAVDMTAASLPRVDSELMHSLDYAVSGSVAASTASVWDDDAPENDETDNKRHARKSSLFALRDMTPIGRAQRSVPSRWQAATAP